MLFMLDIIPEPKKLMVQKYGDFVIMSNVNI